MKISSSILAWNESKTIDLALKSIVGFAHEAVIIDTGSMDGTPKIARIWMDKLNLGGEVKQFKFKNSTDFQKARIEAWNACSGNWILMQNSTTVLSDALKKELSNHARRHSGKACNVRSFNLIGDYEHYYANRPFMAFHRVFAEKNAKYRKTGVDPYFVGGSRSAKNWAVNLSRVRPAWRSWYRGEPFDRQYYKRGDRNWANKSNRQAEWFRIKRYPSLIEFTEAEYGLTLEDVKRKAPAWYLRQLQLEATPLTKAYRARLPEVIIEEMKNPRYKLIYKGGKIVGRHPEI